MSKYYPPVIEGTIPAFYGTTLVVPFSMNRAVAKTDIKGFSLKIKTIQTNTFIANVESISYDTSQAKFDISKIGLVAGQYYKLQLAYIANDEYSTIGYYSTVGVVKYYGIEGPKIYVDGLSNKKSNLYIGSYIGVFEHEDDPTEKIAQYRFLITYSNSNEVFYDTGWLLHNTINDVDSLSANDIFKYTDDLDDDKTYYLQYQVITTNRMECFSPKYNIMQKDSIGSSLNLEFNAITNYDDGFVLLTLKSLGSAGENSTLTGAFEISRQNIKNPRHWEVIDLFILQNEVATKTYWRDFTVTHGETYRYAIRQFNEAGVYTNRVLSNEVFVDFEDAFLFDGKRQLKIRYNPKVSSFKNDIPESKTDTIGSKYPFIFRNGHVNYKEFPISGLISYFSDEQELFLTNEEIGIVDTTNLARDETKCNDELPLNAKTTSLTNYNIAAERKFKLEVLEWLTNGEPKLFRSPTEGNYIVRLLNTSLTPTDTVGRMLHSFNCTAYEIAECNYNNLISFGFIDNSLSADEKERGYYRTVPLGWQTHENDEYGYIPIITGKNPNYLMDEDGYIELLKDPYSAKTLHAYAIYFDDMNSGDSIWINGERHLIGSTGQFILEKAEDINSVKIKAIEDIAYLHEDEYNKAIAEYEEINENKENWIAEKEEELERFSNALAQKKEEIDNFCENSPIVLEDPGVIAYNNQINILQTDIENKENEIDDITNNSADETGLKYWENLKEIKENEIEILESDISSLKNEKQEKENDVLNLNEEISILSEEHTAIETNLSAAERRLEYLDSLDENELNTEIANFNTEINEIEQLSTSIDGKISRMNLWRNYLVNDALHDIETIIDAFERNGYDMQTGVWEKLDVLNNENGEIWEQISSIDTIIDEKNTNLLELQSTLTSHQEQLNNAAQQNSEILEFDSYYELLEGIAEIENEIIEKQNEILILYQSIIEDEENAFDYAAQIKTLELEVQNLENQKEIYNNNIEDYGSYYNTIKIDEDNINNLNSEINSLQEQKNELNNDYQSNYEQIQDYYDKADRIDTYYNRRAGNWDNSVRGHFCSFSQDLTRDDNNEKYYIYIDNQKYIVNKNGGEKLPYSPLLTSSDNSTYLFWIDLKADIEDVLNQYDTINGAFEQYKTNLSEEKEDIITERNEVQALLDEKTSQNVELRIIILQAQLYINENEQREKRILKEQNETNILELKDSIESKESDLEEIQNEINQNINIKISSFYQRIELLNNDIQNKEQQISFLLSEKKNYILTIDVQELQNLLKDENTLNQKIEALQIQIDKLYNIINLLPKQEDYIYSDNNTQNYILEDYNGLFTYKYTDLYANSFDLISGQTLVDYPCRQFIGERMDKNIADYLVDVRTELLNVLQIQADLKQIEDIYTWKDAAAFDSAELSYDDFNEWFSFDRTKMPTKENQSNKGYSYDDIMGRDFNPLIVENNITKQKNSLYIYKIHPIFTHKDYNLDNEIPNNYIETLSPWEKDELRIEVIQMLNKYNLTLEQVSTFVNYKNIDDIIIYENKEKTIAEMINIIWLTPEDFILLEKYYGKENFNYNMSNEDPEDSHPRIISVYKDGKWESIPVEYHRNEGYYVDATYYNVDPYKEFDKYHTFEEDYYLIYKDGRYEVVNGYSGRVYINTGFSSGVVYNETNGELYTEDGQVLQPYIDLTESGSFKTTLIPDITDIYVGDGVILNISYQAREIKYIVEETDEKLRQKRQAWDEAVTNYTDLFYTRKNTVEELYDYYDEDWRENYDVLLSTSKTNLAKINPAKQEYLACLEERIKRYKEDRGIE